MKAVVVLCAAVTLVSAQDFAPFLQNPAFVRRQLACVAGTGSCDGIGRFLTRAAAEVLSRNCANCTPEQRSNANRLLTFIRNNYPTEYGQIYNRFRG
ncbi:uncharacterized protein LOC128996472 [Macrosteles quadrilineatus]|uniref:uncharacterized protein LOC128996472 n=1 Tax=Macrosteles quadrilineatus TaxID=74068 RepID=UPI0023E1CFE8|nr:uncharacterized protein LOC128996472 [Macrosteles quadrilineatus]